jgi:phenylacetate-coenzyme A ligase PaaK-like adenylate-forming protein
MYQDWLKYEPYELDFNEKQNLLVKELNQLTKFHFKNCESYARILKSQNFDTIQFENLKDFPFLPVRLFKNRDLKSVNDDEVVKTMTSSGTSGQQVSRIFLDKATAHLQTKVLTKIVSSYIGVKRLPMLILDSEAVVKDRNLFSARGAGILGFSMFGSKRVFAFDDEMKLNEKAISDFLLDHKGQKVLLFGFTFIVYAYFLKSLEKSKQKFDLSNGILIHGGGWKKLLSEAISSEHFKNRLNRVCGLNRIYDYYGMVEQTGSVFMECEHGYLHTPVYADVIIRRSNDFSVAEFGEIGIIQVISLLPLSYPGHSLLTEDEGVIVGEDTCNCGRLGKYFKIIGRIKLAEIRGCSDTFEGRV